MARNSGDLKLRVARAAEAVLSRQPYVSPIDVFCGIGWLASTQVDAWRRGRMDSLAPAIQAGPAKIGAALSIFGEWAKEKGLHPSEAQYMRPTRSGATPLIFSDAADSLTEKSFRTHYVSPGLTEPKRKNLEDKLARAPQPVVFEIVRESQCAECGAELPRGSFLFMEADQPLCLYCTGFAELEYLPAGDVALTRRAGKYSARTAVVVRFSRSRGRYERQGLLVEAAALEKAERECVDDFEQRAAARIRAAGQRREQDRGMVAEMATQIVKLFPACPPAEASAIAEHTAVRGSGRVGRTAAGRAMESSALTAAVIAAVRHRHTAYDQLLARQTPREVARKQVAATIDQILTAWRKE
jgi:hypothetical protein